MTSMGWVIFVVTYVLISLRRLDWLGFDRPAGALLGAVACVAIGVLTPNEALASVDQSTILLLFGVMGMGAFLSVDGFFSGIQSLVSKIARTPERLLALVVWGSGLLAAFITNDAVCVLGAPLVLELVRRCRLPAAPYLLALATAANTGSVATLVGNPQNMLCGVLGGLHYRDHLVLMTPVAIVGLSLNHLVVWAAFRTSLSSGRLESSPLASSPDPAPMSPRIWITLPVIVGSAVVYTLGGNLAWTACAGFVLLMLIHRRDTRGLWPKIDWSLLLFFAGLFVVVEGLTKSGVPARFFAEFPLADGEVSTWAFIRLSGLFLLGSNIVSNVPFILVVKDQMSTLPSPRLGWELLAMASTFAGNLTLLGSVANIIVAEAARDVGGLGFWQYFRVGCPIALATTAVGVVWLLLTAA